MFLKGLCVNVLNRILSLAGPVLMSRIILFVQKPDADYIEGVALIALIVLLKFSWGVSWAHTRFINVKINCEYPSQFILYPLTLENGRFQELYCCKQLNL